MVLTDVSLTKMAEERQMSSVNSVRQERLSSARPDLIIGYKIRPVIWRMHLRHQLSGLEKLENSREVISRSCVDLVNC